MSVILKNFIVNLFPFLQWTRTYNLEKAFGDLVAGITVALTLIPQSMAYSALAGFDPQYGLYASVMGGFVYAFMGTCPQVNIGPSALISLLTFSYTNGTNIDFAILLCFMAGIVQLVTGVVQLGFVMDFISVPVISGFTSAAALMVASSQIKGLLGIKFKAATFVDTWIKVFKHIGETRISDSLLSLFCCVTLTLMQFLKKIPCKKPISDGEIRRAATRKKILWFIAVSRNAVVVLLASVAAFLMYNSLNDPFYLTGKITPGLPLPRPPPFQSKVDDKVYTGGQMLAHLGTGLLVVPLISILINVAIAKAFARGKKVDATQEILATAACSIISSFFESIPVSGSISRSAVSDASGVRTPAAGVYTGTLVILTLLLLTPYFYYIPRAALSSVIVCAVLNMVEIAVIVQLWKVSRIDLIPLVGCFLCSLGLGVELGLICGVGFDVLLLLFYNSRPPLDIQHVTDGSLPPHYAIHPVGRLSFAGAERVRSKLLSLSSSQEEKEPSSEAATSKAKPQVLVVYCESLHRLDFTFLQSLKMLETDWRPNFKIIFCNARPSVKEQLKGVLTDSVYCDSGELRSHLTGAPVTTAIPEEGSSKKTNV